MTRGAAGSILTTIMIAPVRKLTGAEYLELERAAEFRSELIEGEIVAMSGGSFAHSSLIAGLAREFGNRLRKGPCRVLVSDQRVLVSETSLYTYPDVVVVCGQPQFLDDRRDTLLNPTLLAEVLSPSTERYDRGRKFAHYREIPSLTEYLLVAQDEPRIESYVRAEDGRWIFREATGLEATLELPSLGIQLPLAEVYDQVDFATAARGEPTILAP